MLHDGVVDVCGGIENQWHRWDDEVVRGDASAVAEQDGHLHHACFPHSGALLLSGLAQNLQGNLLASLVPGDGSNDKVKLVLHACQQSADGL